MSKLPLVPVLFCVVAALLVSTTAAIGDFEKGDAASETVKGRFLAGRVRRLLEQPVANPGSVDEPEPLEFHTTRALLGDKLVICFHEVTLVKDVNEIKFKVDENVALEDFVPQENATIEQVAGNEDKVKLEKKKGLHIKYKCDKDNEIIEVVLGEVEDSKAFKKVLASIKSP